jgi:hypothetical protein
MTSNPESPRQRRSSHQNLNSGGRSTTVFIQGSGHERLNVFNIKNALAEAKGMQEKNKFPIKFITWRQNATKELVAVPDAILIMELRVIREGGQCFERITDWKFSNSLPEGMILTDKPTSI